jgi:hypothetical protein
MAQDRFSVRNAEFQQGAFLLPIANRGREAPFFCAGMPSHGGEIEVIGLREPDPEGPIATGRGFSGLKATAPSGELKPRMIFVRRLSVRAEALTYQP